MDVHGSHYHLVDGLDDWGRCVDPVSGLPLVEAWADPAATGFEYDPERGGLRLRRDTPLFRRAGRTARLDPDARRGVGRDGFGNWYWIDADRRGIRRRAASASAAASWWSVDQLSAGCGCRAAGATFTHVGPCAPAAVRLQGLAVTIHQYLLVGYSELAAPGSGLLIFDLHGGGAPLRMRWPDGSAFRPWDLADTPDGGAVVLDAEHSCYWRLDEHLRLRGPRPGPAPFTPAHDRSAAPVSGAIVAAPWPLRDAAGGSLDAVSIEPGPDDSVLVLAGGSAAAYSTLYRFDGEQLRWTTPLRDVVQVVDPRDPAATAAAYSLLGHDFCYLPGPPAKLCVADAEGGQVIAFTLDAGTGAVRADDDFVPMRRWAGRALVRSGTGAWYDFGERWIPLAVFTECRFASTATLVTPADGTGAVTGDTFDSRRPGCVWHRLFLDAQLPTGTSVTIRARAADDPGLLALEPWLEQPVPYLRTGGPELPWLDVWADLRDAGGGLPDRAGTWELLFQQVTGRHLQLQVTIAGNGRSSPLLRSVRAWFPRFSYVEHYLPAIYPQSDAPDGFLERFLANVEGLYTGVEEHIEHAHLLLDARTARTADLPWLASWFGLALDPLWDTRQRRFLIRHVDAFYRRRGTVSGLIATLRTFLDPAVDEHVFEHTATAGVRVVERFLTRDVGGAAHGSSEPDGPSRVRRSAHRFDVVVPAGLSADEAAMVSRIVQAGKPAHTEFRIRRFDEVFEVGQARLGLDTELAHGGSFVRLVVGSGVLAGGFLGYGHPFDLTDRIVIDRDRFGALPAL